MSTASSASNTNQGRHGSMTEGPVVSAPTRRPSPAMRGDQPAITLRRAGGPQMPSAREGNVCGGHAWRVDGNQLCEMGHGCIYSRCQSMKEERVVRWWHLALEVQRILSKTIDMCGEVWAQT